MTCIVGIVKGQQVWMGGDSRVGYDNSGFGTMAGHKVFIRENMLIGVSGSARLSNLLSYGFQPPLHPSTVSNEEYLVINMTGALRTLLEAHGSSQTAEGLDLQNGHLLVAYLGGLYTIYNDFSVVRTDAAYAAIGSGAPYALGAMAVLSARVAPEERLYRALKAAAQHDPFVGAPFYTYHADWSQKEEA